MRVFQLWFTALAVIDSAVAKSPAPRETYAEVPGARIWYTDTKNSESLIVPEAGHSTYWEKPDIFNRAVLDFIRKH